jgi:hypothetical protein
MRTGKGIADRALALAAADTDEQTAIAELSHLAGNDQRSAIQAVAVCMSSGADQAVRRKAIEWLTNVLIQKNRGSVEQPNFSTRVQKAFGNLDGASAAQNYLPILLENMKDIAHAQRRSMMLWLFGAAAFELFNRAAIAEATLGPLKLTDISFIHKGLPVFLAYLLYDVTAVGVVYVYSEVVWSETIRLVQEPLASSGLDLLLLPFGTSLIGPIWISSSRRWNSVVRFFTAILRLSTVIVPLVFIGYALIYLYIVFGPHDLLVWLSTFFTLGFLLYAVIIFFASGTNKMRKWTTRRMLDSEPF